TNQRPVLITCDVLPTKLADVVGDRVASRLAEMCRGGLHLMRGADRRLAGAAGPTGGPTNSPNPPATSRPGPGPA
ncbi:hypothetical protein KBZ21_48330, partial [Streptomyces sp. A73]|nr:hypothetical protein [Streptomyces sp. A73]